MNSYKIHSTIAGAIAALGEVQVTAKWKETANQKRGERAITIPMECVKAPEVPEAFRALVESCLMAAAEQTLKSHCTDSPNNWEILATAFERPQLVESFIAKNDEWMTKAQLELAFTGSATWKRIVSRPQFGTDAAYQANANWYKGLVMAVANKQAHVSKNDRDTCIAKMEPTDLATEFGIFVVRRFEQMAKKDQAPQAYSAADL